MNWAHLEERLGIAERVLEQGVAGGAAWQLRPQNGAIWQHLHDHSPNIYSGDILYSLLSLVYNTETEMFIPELHDYRCTHHHQ